MRQHKDPPLPMAQLWAGSAEVMEHQLTIQLTRYPSQ